MRHWRDALHPDPWINDSEPEVFPVLRRSHGGGRVRKAKGRRQLGLHLALISILAVTLLPLLFLVNNSLRTNSELNHSFFGVPKAAAEGVGATQQRLAGKTAFDVAESSDRGAKVDRLSYGEA